MAIIQLLRKNSRMSNTEIARRVGLSEGSVRLRIRRLVDSGVIRKFTVELSGGTGVEAIVLVRSIANRTKEVTREVARLSEAAFETSGEYDTAALLFARDVDELNVKVDRIRKIKGVVSTTTLIRLAED